ncbi:MAG: hypothetical protein ACT4OI_07300 [Methanobacteriota archaeon]
MLVDPETGILARAERTLDLMHRWGYAPTVEVLAHDLFDGSVGVADVLASLASADRVLVDDGFVCLRGHEDLLAKSRLRRETHRELNGGPVAVAHEFARDLARACPFVECIALSGSVASGGYAPGDDIDFDLVVRAGTKYTSYLVANLVGLKFSWRLRGRSTSDEHRTPFLPKVTCVNVVWPDDHTRPFVRRDGALAFELLRCTPLFGSERFRELLRDNPWVEEYFPQVSARAWTDAVARKPGVLAHALDAVARRPRALARLEAASRWLAWIAYRGVQASRRRNPVAMERMRFLRRVKFPYEVFQD